MSGTKRSPSPPAAQVKRNKISRYKFYIVYDTSKTSGNDIPLQDAIEEERYRTYMEGMDHLAESIRPSTSSYALVRVVNEKHPFGCSCEQCCDASWTRSVRLKTRVYVKVAMLTNTLSRSTLVYYRRAAFGADVGEEVVKEVEWPPLNIFPLSVSEVEASDQDE